MKPGCGFPGHNYPNTSRSPGSGLDPEKIRSGCTPLYITIEPHEIHVHGLKVHGYNAENWGSVRKKTNAESFSSPLQSNARLFVASFHWIYILIGKAKLLKL